VPLERCPWSWRQRRAGEKRYPAQRIPCQMQYRGGHRAGLRRGTRLG
jgi:hypothetical protein